MSARKRLQHVCNAYCRADRNEHAQVIWVPVSLTHADLQAYLHRPAHALVAGADVVRLVTVRAAPEAAPDGVRYGIEGLIDDDGDTEMRAWLLTYTPLYTSLYAPISSGTTLQDVS